MRFRTEYRAEHAPFSLTPEHPVVFLGSCFADNISARMREGLWNARKFLGTLYNPASISTALEMALFGEMPAERFSEHLFEDRQGWHSWLHDSSFSSALIGDSIARYMQTIEDFRTTLGKARALFITFGTSICYCLSEKPGYIVGNCHKQPAALFSSRRLSVEEIADRWTSMVDKIRFSYPDVHLIFTVSPVRHIKDGFAGNSRSKAILLLAIEELCRRRPECHYFPAYEIMNDDLRDYRFYASDLLHPSLEGVEYIWEIFRDTYMDSQAISLFSQGEKVLKAMRHRPLGADDAARKAYFEKARENADSFLARHPGMAIPCD